MELSFAEVSPEQQESEAKPTETEDAGSSAADGDKATSDPAEDAPPPVAEITEKKAASCPEAQEELRVQLAIAPAITVVEAAYEVAVHNGPLYPLWNVVSSRLAEMEFEALDAMLLLDCLVRMDATDPVLLDRIVDRIECHYFSTFGSKLDLHFREHPVVGMFQHKGSFQSLVNALPLAHKVKIIIMDDFFRDLGLLPAKSLQPEPEPKKRWRTMDPIDLEAWEKDRFERGRTKVLRTRARYVEAKISRMQAGKKLKAVLSLQLMQLLPLANAETLAHVAQLCAMTQQRRLLHGDLQDDFQEGLCERLLTLNKEELVPYIVALAAGLRNFQGPQAFRAWRKKLLPVVVHVAYDTTRFLHVLDQQRCIHSHLRGVAKKRTCAQRRAEDAAESGEASERDGRAADLANMDEEMVLRAERAAELFIAVATARQVQLDTRLYDALAGPLVDSLGSWRGTAGAAVATEEGSALLLPLGTLADVLDACVVSGVGDAALPRAMADLFTEQFGRDIQAERFELSNYAIADLCAVVHGATLLCEDPVEELVDLVWAAAQPSFGRAKPHLRLMLINAVVRGGSEKLLTSTHFITVVDEQVVQNLDLDPGILGKLGS